MHCRACGVHAPDDANFCVSCGDDLRAQREDEALGDDDPDTGEIEPVDDTAARAPIDPAPVSSPPGYAPSPEGDELVDCPVCGAANSPRRYLCGRCGADLATGDPSEQPVVPSPASGASGRTTPIPNELEPSGRGPGWRTGLLIVGVGLLLGAMIGVLFALEVGPLGDDPAAGVDGPLFDASAYPEEPTELPVTTVAASTARGGPDGGFGPGLMLDGELTTAWNSSGARNPSGVGEIIEVDFPEPVWLSQIVFANGDQADDETYLANARAKRVRVELDGGSVFVVNLLDEQGEQAVRLPVPRLTTEARFEVLEVYPGDTYDDLALSEIRFRGYVANEDDATAGVADRAAER